MSTLYISPTGSGNRSGSDWTNAATITSLDSMIKKAGAGGTVLLQADAGDYKVTGPINIYQNAAGAGVTIKGVTKAGADMDAHILGTRSAVYSASNAAGNELFKFQAGAGNLTFKNMSIDNTGTAFRAAGDVHDITIQNVDAHNVGRFFEDYAGGTNKTATISGLTLADINVTGFSRGVIRLQYDSHDVVIQNVYGDSQRQDGDNFAIGVHLDGTVHDVLISHTTMANATDTTHTYWNGDGFAAESKVYNLVLQDTVARGNTDAGYDLKSSNTTLINTLAENNSRNYRVWGDVEMINPTGLNPEKRGGALNSQGQVWIGDGATLSITGGYFADAGSATKVFENDGGKVTLIDTEVVYANRLSLGGGITGLASLDLVKIAATGVHSAGLDVDALMTGLLPPVVVVLPAPPPPAIVEAEPGKTFISTIARETFIATEGADRFVYKQPAKTGSDIINGFGATDLMQTSKALADGNRDGIIAFGDNGLLDLGSKSGTVKIAGVSALRALGQVDGAFVYGDASVRPLKALEGKLGVADTLSGDKADKVANTFFVDTALGLALGQDKLALFGSKDILVTTSKIAPGAVVPSIAGKVVIDLDGAHLGSLAISNISGASVNALEYDGAVTAHGHDYFVYSLLGSSAGTANLAF